ncbi:MAG TPA: ADP-forming succinate--CoA ligase subunit beta [Chloroflexota bacterium]|nr:ADP-forming succinate--CoA ligase subunit beta [Chloroflexota bacterium]
MKLYEFQAKEIFARYGIPIPEGEAASDPDSARAIASRLGGRVVVKAQVHVGGRGKAGGIKLADTPADARTLAAGMLGQPLKGLVVRHVLVERALDIAAEYYLSATIDRMSKRVIMMASAMGGVDIEEVAASHPDKIVKLVVDPAYGPLDFQIRDLITEAGFALPAARAIGGVAHALYELMLRCDASLVEINPLVVTGTGEVIAADAKFDVDDNALYRQKDLVQYREETEEDPIEAEAHRRGVTYVRLSGDIGIIGNGAGLVMTTLDLVTREGGRPANFLDIGGGAQAESVRTAIEILLMDPNVKGILFNIFGGITRGDEVAKGILAGTESLDIRVPVVVRMAGTRSAEGRALLQGTNLVAAAGPIEAARKIIELARAQPAAARSGPESTSGELG